MVILNSQLIQGSAVCVGSSADSSPIPSAQNIFRNRERTRRGGEGEWRRWSGKLWPSGRLAVGYVKPKKEALKRDKEYEKNYAKQYTRSINFATVPDEYDCSRSSNEQLQKAGIEYEEVLTWTPCGAKLPSPESVSGSGRSPGLVIASELSHGGEYDEFLSSQGAKEVSRNKVTTGRRNGLKGISSYGRNMVESGAALMQEFYGKDALTFATLTLPAFDPATVALINSRKDEIARRVGEKLGRWQKSQGLPVAWLGVVEIQEKRYQRTGVLALHWHLLYVNKKPINRAGRYGKGFRLGSWVMGVGVLECLFQSVLFNIIKKDSEASQKYLSPEKIDMKAACNVERVKKDAAAYLGKYLSKGSQLVRKIVDDLSGQWQSIEDENGEKVEYYEPFSEQVVQENLSQIPSQWWFANKFVKRLVWERTIPLSESVCDWLIGRYQDLSDSGFLSYVSPVVAVYQEREFILGIAGKVSPQKVESLVRLL